MNKYSLLALLLGVLLLSGCRSQRRAARQRESLQSAIQETTTNTGQLIADGKSQAGKEPQTPVRQRNTTVEALQAHLNMTLRSGNKSINVGGTFRVKRNDVVQMNLVYTVLILPVNVGTLEITPDDILVVDRIGKRYCRVAYSEAEQFRKYGVDFNFLQDLFWGDGGIQSNPYVACTYDSWTNLSQGRFPLGMTFTLNKAKQKATAIIQLSDIRETAQWDNRTKVGQKYTQVSLDTVMKALVNAKF